MANLDSPKGFQPYGVLRQVAVLEAGSTVYPGEFIKMASDGQIDACSAGDDIMGLCLDYGVVGDKVRVSVSPDQLYVGQADETEIDAQTDVGNMTDIVATAGNSTYKASRQEVDSSLIGNASAQLLILGIEARPDNAFGGFVDVICKINEHQQFGENDAAGTN